jgi:hypothetical protein
MERIKIDFETYNKLREIAHKAVDKAIREIFTYGSLDEYVDRHLVESSDQFAQLVKYGELKGYRYKDWNGNSDYIPEFMLDYNYPCTVYSDFNKKTWWVDLHNMTMDHPAFTSLADRIFNHTRLIGA